LTNKLTSSIRSI